MTEDTREIGRGFADAAARTLHQKSRSERRLDMLGEAKVHTILPVKDLTAAPKFYEEALGLQKVHEEPGGAVTSTSPGR